MGYSAPCPADFTHAWHGNTQAVYAKEKNTMLTKGVICTECGGIWIYGSGNPAERLVEFYRLDPSKKPVRKRNTSSSPV
jgi:hypothetical protein